MNNFIGSRDTRNKDILWNEWIYFFVNWSLRNLIGKKRIMIDWDKGRIFLDWETFLSLKEMPLSMK